MPQCQKQGIKAAGFHRLMNLIGKSRTGININMKDTPAVDFRDTLNLPDTDFSMKAKLSEREPERLSHWESINLWKRILEQRSGSKPYTLHDGPPYANGDIHIGHALNKVLKDVINRFFTMKDRLVYYVPGFDCHGLPIEQKVISRLKGKASRMEPVEIRKLCHEEATRWIKTQTEQFQRLGIAGDWKNAYRTLDPQVEVGILKALRGLVQKGFVRKGLKPVLWDPVYRTALAEAEIEYENHVSDSIYVRFPLIDSGAVASLSGLDHVSLVIWTTTPWTLPANLGVCLHPEFEYVIVRTADEHFIIARGLVESFWKDCGKGELDIVGGVNASDLEHMKCTHPVLEGKTSLVILGRHVTLEAGTGCVHTAPGHGVDDFIVGKQYGLDVFVPVDEGGRFTKDYPEMQGTSVFEANPKIVGFIENKGLLVNHRKFEHQYPYSWRSHKPVIFRATEQWFIELDSSGIREAALKSINEEVQWIPEWGRDRIYNMVEQRPEWCLSRQRSWGVPIPSIRSRKSGESILDVRVIDHLIERVKASGTDIWFTDSMENLLPEGFRYEKTGESDPADFEKEYDIVDVWFDSGSTHVGVLEMMDGLEAPADLYLEGSDQHRGWFQSSLLISLGIRDRPPFRAVLTHGFVLDQDGIAMSKHKGNVISPKEIIQRLGADVLRLWVISEDYRSDIHLSNESLKRISEAYRRIRNTFRFLLGNLADFKTEEDRVPVEQLESLDRWILCKLNHLVEKVEKFYEKFEFHRIYHLVHNFCTRQLSAHYLDIVKDRLYCSGPQDLTRRAAQTCCSYLLETLTRTLAPVLVFTTDEVWDHLGDTGCESVHMSDFPGVNCEWSDPGIESEMDLLLELKADVSQLLEEERRAGVIGHSLDASVAIQAASEQDLSYLNEKIGLLKQLFIVSKVEIEENTQSVEGGGRTIRAERAAGEKCERCWMYDQRVGEDEKFPTLCCRCTEVVRRII
jgi:isoleucyl-tRNA synthetase